jgi:hypothetical protein
MIKRREALKGRSGKLPSVTEEAGMRYFIEVSRFNAHIALFDLGVSQNPAFLSESSFVPSLDFALVNTDPLSKSNAADSDAVAVSDACNVAYSIRLRDPIAEHEPPSKKRKAVRFADDESI